MGRSGVEISQFAMEGSIKDVLNQAWSFPAILGVVGLSIFYST